MPDNGVGLGQVGSQNNNGGSGWNFPDNQYTLTQKYADPNTSLTYFGSRHYDPEMGVWLTQDSYRGAVPNPQSQHRYLYNYASPVNYQDVYGFEPNKNQIGTVDYWVGWVAEEEAKLVDNPTKEQRRQIFKTVSDQSLADVNNLDTLPYRVTIPIENFDNRETLFGRYLYNETYGTLNPTSHYIDATHFFAGAYYSSKTISPLNIPFPGRNVTLILGYGNEVIQALLGALGNTEVGQSFLSPEDLESNRASVDFGKYVDLSKPIAPQLKKFLLEKAKAYNGVADMQCVLPESFSSLPEKDVRKFTFFKSITEYFFYKK